MMNERKSNLRNILFNRILNTVWIFLFCILKTKYMLYVSLHLFDLMPSFSSKSSRLGDFFLLDSENRLSSFIVVCKFMFLVIDGHFLSPPPLVLLLPPDGLPQPLLLGPAGRRDLLVRPEGPLDEPPGRGRAGGGARFVGQEILAD